MAKTMRDLLGQPRLLERLGQRLVSGEASHAYLVSGPRSIGKHTLALRVAQTLTCEDPARPGGCGECLGCRKVERGSHPDVREVRKLPDRRDISIEQIREMAQDLALRPLEGRQRVVIIDDAADLSDAAQDSLLKTLEEPPAHAVLLIVARSPWSLKETVVSRCQSLELRPVSTPRIETFVAERTGDRALARAVAPLAAGRPGLALALAGDEQLGAQRTAIVDELFTLLGAGLVDRLGWAARTAEETRAAGSLQRQEPRTALAERLALWLELLRDAALAGSDVARLHADRAERTERLGELIPPPQLASLAALVERLRDDLDRNSNARAALELLILRLPYLKEFARAA